MKKLYLMVVAAMMATVSVNAQNGYDDTKHEVAISFGAGSNSQIIDAFEELTTVMVGATYDDEKFTGPMSVEYFYHVKPWFGVGGILAYGSMKEDLFLGGKRGGKDGEVKNSYITLMPAVKFDWLRKKYFGMYSKLAVGATMRHEKIDYNSADNDDFDESEVHVNWQVSLLGIEAGSPTLRGFVELGAGEQGIGLIGLRYKF